MILKTIAAFILAAFLSVAVSYLASGWIEKRTIEVVRSTLQDGGHEWTEIDANGLQVALSGTAPDEATRLRVVNAVGRVIDPDRIIDHLEVQAFEERKPPQFTVEMLRNGEGISLIGMIPTAAGREAFTRAIENTVTEGTVTDMLETTNFAVPEGWEDTIEFATNALKTLPKSKISVTADRVEITAISDSPEQKRAIEAELLRKAPSRLQLVLNISSPRPVISPFTLRFKLHDGVAAFDACSAETEESRSKILTSAAGVGQLRDRSVCAIGLGVPSPNWARAVKIAMNGLKELGGGTLTFSDADVTLIALDTTEQGVFDHVVGDLDATLPEVFSLHAVLPEKIVVDGTGEGEIPEFVATKSPEGLVQLRGRLPDDKIENIVGAFAHAKFGSDAVYLATRDDPDLPSNWAVRVLAALEALATLEHGSVVVQANYLEIRGASGSQDGSDEVSRLLASKLDDDTNFEVNIHYDELLDRILAIPKPQKCVDRINVILAANKIVFKPASAEIAESASSTIDKIAKIVDLCKRTQMEIGGHTDSQGGETMNQNLSQQRAHAVLVAIMDRRVLTDNLVARGYGETVPIADNNFENGREANRRIEFTLLTDDDIDGDIDAKQSDASEQSQKEGEQTSEQN